MHFKSESRCAEAHLLMQSAYSRTCSFHRNFSRYATCRTLKECRKIKLKPKSIVWNLIFQYRHRQVSGFNLVNITTIMTFGTRKGCSIIQIKKQFQIINFYKLLNALLIWGMNYDLPGRQYISKLCDEPAQQVAIIRCIKFILIRFYFCII